MDTTRHGNLFSVHNRNSEAVSAYEKNLGLSGNPNLHLGESKHKTPLREVEIVNIPDIEKDFGSYSRRGKGLHIVIFIPFRNTEYGPKDKR